MNGVDRENHNARIACAVGAVDCFGCQNSVQSAKTLTGHKPCTPE